jgi:hypothetical protein
MTLNLDSVSARLYRWFYDKEQMPDNLCPYFWKLVLMWLMILPYMVVTLPVQIRTKFRQKPIDETIAYTIGVYILLAMLVIYSILPIHLFFGVDGWFIDGALPGSAGLWTVTIALGIFGLIEFLRKKYKKSKRMYDSYGRKIYYPIKKPNIIVEFIKAKYNKYCPKITWDKKTD